MTQISSIDDLLMGVGNSQQPATPEHKEKAQEKPNPVEEKVSDDNVEVEYESDPLPDEERESEDIDEEKSETKKTDSDNAEEKDDLDEYGTQKEQMPKGLKDRLDRKDRQYQQEVAQRDNEIAQLRAQLTQQGASKEVQQAVKDFKYDPNEEVAWEKQLSEFVKHTITNMQNEQQQQQRQTEDQHAEREFKQKFTQGIEGYSDFREVVGNQPIDDAMTLALRGMNNPAAFIYAASKRHPKELERISKLKDPYARMVEMGKLEERMRRNKPTTQAPRPLGRTKEDTPARVTPKQKDMTGDDLLAKADAKRLSVVKNRHRIN